MLRIEKSNKNIFSKPFKELPGGTIFTWGNPEALNCYMKILMPTIDKEGSIYNAFFLKTGALSYFSPDEEVQEVDSALLTVKI